MHDGDRMLPDPRPIRGERLRLTGVVPRQGITDPQRQMWQLKWHIVGTPYCVYSYLPVTQHRAYLHRQFLEAMHRRGEPVDYGVFDIMLIEERIGRDCWGVLRFEEGNGLGHTQGMWTVRQLRHRAGIQRMGPGQYTFSEELDDEHRRYW